MFLEPAERTSEADSSKKHGEAICHVVFQIARTYWRSVAYRHSRASRIVASLLRRNFTHTCVIFLSTPLCKFFYSLGSLKYFCQMCLPQISHKVFYEVSIGHPIKSCTKSSTKSSTKCRSSLRSICDQRFCKISEQTFHKNISEKLSRNICTKLSKRVCDILTKTSTHSYISQKV